MSSAFLTSDYFIRPYEIVNLLTVVDRLIFGCPSTFFTKFVYEFYFQCTVWPTWIPTEVNGYFDHYLKG